MVLKYAAEKRRADSSAFQGLHPEAGLWAHVCHSERAGGRVMSKEMQTDGPLVCS